MKSKITKIKSKSKILVLGFVLFVLIGFFNPVLEAQAQTNPGTCTSYSNGVASPSGCTIPPGSCYDRNNNPTNLNWGQCKINPGYNWNTSAPGPATPNRVFEIVKDFVPKAKVAEASLNVPTTKSRILFYKRDSKMGTLWENALQDNYRIEDEGVVEAIPYFISPKNLSNPALIWTWGLNNAQVFSSRITPNIIPLRTTAGVSGKALLRLDIENKYQITQTVNQEININF